MNDENKQLFDGVVAQIKNKWHSTYPQHPLRLLSDGCKEYSRHFELEQICMWRNWEYQVVHCHDAIRRSVTLSKLATNQRMHQTLIYSAIYESSHVDGREDHFNKFALAYGLYD